MKKTQHSIIRCQQRGIRESNLELITSIGRLIKKSSGALEILTEKKNINKPYNFINNAFKISTSCEAKL